MTPPRAYIMIGTPAYGGLEYVNYVEALLNSIKMLATVNIHLEPCFLTNESLITRGRNTIVAKFLSDKKYTHLLFIDADENWEPYTILRLIMHDKDIIGVPVPHKTYKWQMLTKNKAALKLITTAAEEDRVLTDSEIGTIRTKLMVWNMNLLENSLNSEVKKGLLEVKNIGTGFMMIKRNVLETMCDMYPELKYIQNTGGSLRDTEIDHLYAFFNCEIYQKQYLSEDFLFCKRWTDLGNKIYVDITMPITHTGTHSFTASFAEANDITV